MNVKTMTPEEFDAYLFGRTINYILYNKKGGDPIFRHDYEEARQENLARLRSEEAGRKWAKEKQDNFDTRPSYPLNLAGELLAAMDQARDKS